MVNEKPQHPFQKTRSKRGRLKFNFFAGGTAVHREGLLSENAPEQEESENRSKNRDGEH